MPLEGHRNATKITHGESVHLRIEHQRFRELDFPGLALDTTHIRNCAHHQGHLAHRARQLLELGLTTVSALILDLHLEGLASKRHTFGLQLLCGLERESDRLLSASLHKAGGRLHCQPCSERRWRRLGHLEANGLRGVVGKLEGDADLLAHLDLAELEVVGRRWRRHLGKPLGRPRLRNVGFVEVPCDLVAETFAKDLDGAGPRVVFEWVAQGADVQLRFRWPWLRRVEAN
mmetsp:Transcript_100412/g.284261  ORF Transcript_100412/g.284261 Transcript_100412/m.284261 type:complete len:231 (+) Transcript_100412:304-996(+)